MATEIKNASSLKLQFNKGLGPNGKAVMGSKTFSNLKESSSADDILEVANAIGNLQKHDLYDVVKIDYTSIS
ncbi:DUF1659 domain-containing protein [Romboutsia ilealis]|uniref:DUF1659 domain-containing protein n=1 Tax=Romboutsia faecis TaxID=2764597 RepID=A0ABR7JRY1_9FIRM|nr:DUF1659 domain-containing protein [Romboutsia faecis]MBC5997666.1 DUF1659 domain-containing protein [Romboutsia faecis]MRN25385.1 DUF1659 domain-containing protein [Romboutsia ilealis]